MDVNYVAILVCGVAAMIIGSVWYGPLFGKTWTKLVGLTKEDFEKGKKTMPQTYGMMFAAALVTSFVLAVIIESVGVVPGPITGMMGAFWVWLGFVAAIKLSDVLFEKKPLKLYFIEIGYYFVFLMVAGAILGSWM